MASKGMSVEYEMVTAAQLVDGDVIYFIGKNWVVSFISYRSTGKAIRAKLVDSNGEHCVVRWELETKIKLVSKVQR